MSDLTWYPTDKIFLDGNWVAATGQLALEDPSTGAEIGTIAAATADDIDAAVAAARASLASDWGRATALERGRVLTRIGQLVQDRTEQLALIEATFPGGSISGAPKFTTNRFDWTSVL